VPSPRIRAAAATAVAAVVPLVAHADNPAAVLETPKVDVIGTTPLPVLGTPLRQVPANVQSVTSKDLEKRRAGDITDYMEQNLGSVNLNQAQANQFQPDVNFRGLTASHLLGLPQGLSVFQDGVRVNEAFGDTVNWDLIPQSAIANMSLIPGSNPVYGLNTLGGAIGIQTKSGFQYPGTSIYGYGGSFGRRSATVETGGHGDRVDYFVTGNYLEDDGWRQFSPSRIANVFGKLGYQSDRTDFDISFTGANNTLEGTQALPVSFMGDRTQPYTYPDTTGNKMSFINAKGSHYFSDTTLLAANLYYRRLDQTTFASNVNDACEGGCAPGDDPAFNDKSTIRQNGYGGSVQLSLLDDLVRRPNQFTLGASADLGDTRFKQYEQEADFTANRGTVALDDFQLETDVRTKNRYYGLYFTDTFSLTDRWTVIGSGRYNIARVSLRDETGLEPALNGDHKFTRFNPAVGVTYNPTSTYTTYFNYSEGMRAPTPVELTCADPNAPCRLPNAFLADPALKPVVSKTFEIGARGQATSWLGWSAALFRTELRDDLQFISTSGAGVNTGYFANVGNTRREGIELGSRIRAGNWGFGANYTYLRATFESEFLLNSPNNTSRDGNDDILVRPGNHIPGLPEHLFKLRADYAFNEKASVGGNLIFSGDQYARGDENNQDAGGKVPSYTTINLDGRYQVTKQFQVFARVINLFDTKYESFGILGANFFPGGVYDNTNVQREQFRAVGMPRAIWVGVRYDFGGATPNGGTASDPN
jgi:iron complex outermembrane receptor protein